MDITQIFIANLISFGFSIAMFCVCLKPNHYFKYGFTLYLSVFFLTFFIQLVVLPAPDPILGCFWIIPHYLFSLSCFQCSAKDAIAAPLTYSCCSSALFLLSTLLLNALQTAFFPDISSNAYFFCILILMILVFFASLALVSHFTFWRILPWWLLLPCFLLFVAESFGHALVDDTFSNRTALGFSALIFSNMLIILSIWVLFEKKRHLSRHIAYIQEQQKLQLEYYSSLCAEHDALIAFQKESIQQIHTLQQACTAPNPADADTLLHSIHQKMQKNYLLVPTHNNAVDALLQNKFHLAETKGCHLLSSLVLKNDLAIDCMDLICILANLLDNAISACSPRDTIQISGVAQKGLLILEVRNPDHGQKLPKQFQLPHLKANGHGSGLSSVEHTAEKYGGQLSLLSHNGIVTARVTLELHES